MRLQDVEVGVVVECTSSYDGNSEIKGQLGKLVHVDEEHLRRPGVRFDKNIGGHELMGTRQKFGCARGRGWYIPIRYLRLIMPAKSKKS